MGSISEDQDPVSKDAAVGAASCHAPPPEPIAGSTNVFRITVRYGESLVLGVPARLQTEDLIFPAGSSVVDRTVQYEKTVRETYGIEEDLVQGLIDLHAPGDQVPAYARNKFCSDCSVSLNRANGKLVRGSSAAWPLNFYQYCNTCKASRHSVYRSDPLSKMGRLIHSCKRLGEFESRDIALHTMMTVAVQGFSFGPARYEPSEVIYLRSMAARSDMHCFWTGLPLSLDPKSGPAIRFSLDRTIFVKGKALDYGSEDQVLVAASLFSNCFFGARNVKQRVQYLNNIERGWAENILWADRAIKNLQEGFDIEREKKRVWTKEWNKKWGEFLRSKKKIGHKDRIEWSQWEWRYFRETCGGRSLVTGQLLDGADANIDRVFDSDGYSTKNCILVERELNFAKHGMTEFESSQRFHGGCKLVYGVSVLRRAVQELLDQTRPHREGLQFLKKEILELISGCEKEIADMGPPVSSIAMAKIKYFECILKLKSSLTALLDGNYSFEYISKHKSDSTKQDCVVTAHENEDSDDDGDDQDYDFAPPSLEGDYRFIQSSLHGLYQRYNRAMNRGKYTLPTAKISELVLLYKGKELSGFISFATFTRIYIETL
ncbi:hypothetical protein BGZ80_003448, partial [Entomortierella chlamydospora]